MSKTIVFIFEAFSNISLFFTNIPLLAHIPSLIIIASGVASPKLQGHATTSIVTNVIMLFPIPKPNIICNINVITAIIMTIGTKYPDILSAIFAIGAFVLLASITSLTISDTVDSFPIFSALYFMNPS